MTHTTHLPERHRNDQWKQPCRVATTAPVTISTAFNAGDTIDGVTLAAGDRILAKDQSTGSQNGIYVAGPSPARAYDMDTSDEVPGAIVYVKAGTANGGKAYKNTNTGAVTLGTTALTFAEFGAGGGGGVVVEDEGGALGTATTLDFVGAGVTATFGAGQATITITGSSIAQIDGTGDGHISFNATSVDMFSPNGWMGGSEWSEFYLKEGRINLVPVHTPGSFSTKGIVMQVGDDGHFLYVSEASSSLLEVHGDSSASYDIAFTDDPSSGGSASPGRFLFADDSGNTSIPSLGVPRKFSSDPTPQVAGECYYNTSTNKVKVWDGSTWNNLW